MQGKAKHHMDGDTVWVPVSDFAVEFNKNPVTIKHWIANGFLLELGYRVKRDFTGHWIIGIPTTEYFKNSATFAAPIA